MAKNSDHLPGFETDDNGGALSGLLAEEDELDRHSLWRIGTWGVGATAAVILAVMSIAIVPAAMGTKLDGNKPSHHTGRSRGGKTNRGMYASTGA